MLFTIGYEAKVINDFVLELKDNNIKKIVDVRELPLSRKKGFSKTPFSKILEEEGIDYIHMKELGNPRELRKKLREDGDINFFFKEYLKYLKTKKTIVEKLYRIVLKEDCCLMCYENLPIKCHRSKICDEIKKIDGNGLKVKHL